MINKLFKQRYFLATVQFLNLIVFVLIIYGAIGITTEDADFAKVLRNTNLPNLIIWSYWWPIIIASAIIFGRYWCTICPMELVTSLFGKFGLRKKPGKFLKSGWLITLLYVMILVLGIHTLEIHRIPQRMAIYMLILFSLAAVTGLIWKKRTFCTYVCPIGHLLGLYSMLSMSKLRVKSSEVCKTCKTKDCVSKANQYNFEGRSCTSELYPPNIQDNRDCILCAQCIKACPKDNISIQKRSIAADLFKDIKLSWSELVFFMIVSSFVIYEILSEWGTSKAILLTLPKLVNQSLDITGPFASTSKSIILFLLVPFIFFFLLAFLKNQFAKENWETAITQLVMSILPITASMHLLKAFLKTTSRIPYWGNAITDPSGVKTAEAILQNPNLLDNQYMSSYITPIVSILAFVLIISGVILSFLVIKKQSHKNITSKWITIIGVLLYATVFILTLIFWKLIA